MILVFFSFGHTTISANFAKALPLCRLWHRHWSNLDTAQLRSLDLILGRFQHIQRTRSLSHASLINMCLTSDPDLLVPACNVRLHACACIYPPLIESPIIFPTPALHLALFHMLRLSDFPHLETIMVDLIVSDHGTRNNAATYSYFESTALLRLL